MTASERSESGVMKLAAVLDLLIGAGLAWLTYGLRGELDYLMPGWPSASGCSRR